VISDTESSPSPPPPESETHSFSPPPPSLAREFSIDNLLVRFHFFIEMVWWTGLAPSPPPPSLQAVHSVLQSVVVHKSFGVVHAQGYLAHKKTPPA
jgi:hypothetical protein